MHLTQPTYKRLASRGGRNPTSTGSGFGGSIKKRGLAPAPFLFWCVCGQQVTAPPISILHSSISQLTVRRGMDSTPPYAGEAGCQLSQKMSRQWGHWRLGRGHGGHYSEAQSLARRLRASWGAFSAGALRSTSMVQMVRIARIIAYSKRYLTVHPPSRVSLGH
jgi:hypothetical protein